LIFIWTMVISTLLSMIGYISKYITIRNVLETPSQDSADSKND